MISSNPFSEFRLECEEIISEALEKVFPDLKIKSVTFIKPPNLSFGQLACSISFGIAKKIKQKPDDIAKIISNVIDKRRFKLIEKIEPSGGYINFFLNFPKFSNLSIESIRFLKEEYGFVKTQTPQNIIVEHTSVNPLHPIHIGQARNPMLGDALARILRCRGHKVLRHYYIDDVGRQSSVLAYGYIKIGMPKPIEKPDVFAGKIYTITSCIVELNRLKKDCKKHKEDSEDSQEVFSKIKEWKNIAQELKKKYPQLFNELFEKISKDSNPEYEINKLNQAYEKGEEKAKKIIRKVSELVLAGFRETLNRVKVYYDSWDWESDFVWNKQVSEVLKGLKNSEFIFYKDGVLEFDAEKVIRVLNLRKKMGLKEEQEIPPLTLVRADGTTLYTTRDIAYTLWKFNRAEKIINVIGMEQSLAQLQLKIALHALGFKKDAENFVHFAYNLVNLPGYKMSSRRGQYISFDEVLDEAIKRAYEEVSKRSPLLSDKEKQDIATFVGIGSVRYALVDVDMTKPVVFTWDRVLNFETNSAPYVQYTHARACSILRKANRIPQKIYYDKLKNKLEYELILLIASFPDVFIEAAEYLKPNIIADYSNVLADKFNTFYNAVPVLKTDSVDLSNSRVALTEAIKIVLSNSLNLIGILAPDRM